MLIDILVIGLALCYRHIVDFDIIMHIAHVGK